MTHRKNETQILFLLIVIAILSFAVYFVISAVRTRARETMGRQPCPSALRQLGQGLLLYQIDNGGVYPARLEDLVISGLLDPSHMVCPVGSDPPAKGATPTELMVAYSKPGHVSF